MSVSGGVRTRLLDDLKKQAELLYHAAVANALTRDAWKRVAETWAQKYVFALAGREVPAGLNKQGAVLLLKAAAGDAHAAEAMKAVMVTGDPLFEPAVPQLDIEDILKKLGFDVRELGGGAMMAAKSSPPGVTREEHRDYPDIDSSGADEDDDDGDDDDDDRF